MNTGISFDYILRVVKYATARDKRNNNPAVGYPKAYNLLESFGTYPTISLAELQAYSVVQVQDRTTAFLDHVRQLEGTSDIGDRNENIHFAPVACPIDPDLRVSMSVANEVQGNQSATNLSTYFQVAGTPEQHATPVFVLLGSIIQVNSLQKNAADLQFIGWYNSIDPTTIIDTNNAYSFQIIENTTMVARWFLSGDGVQLVLIAGLGVANVSGGGTFPLGSTVTARAVVVSGVAFAGWFKNGIMVSGNPVYTFSLQAFTQLEARANKDDYILSTSKTVLQFRSEGETISIIITSKTSDGVAVSFSVDPAFPSWLSISPLQGSDQTSITLTSSENTGELRSTVIKIIQDESGNELLISIENLKSTAGLFVWALNEDDLLSQNTPVPSGRSWAVQRDDDPYNIANFPPPARECTLSDYINHIRENERYFTISRRENHNEPIRYSTALFFWEAKFQQS